MSEYMEKHAVARLIGAPPGYVGYEEGGQLTESVRRRPYSVIPVRRDREGASDVFNILLQILDDGRLTDSQGRTVDFRNTVLIMTSNLGSQFLIEADAGQWEQAETKVTELLRQTFQAGVPEPCRRRDHFPPAHAGRHRADRRHPDGAGRAAARGSQAHARGDARGQGHLVAEGYDPVYGARPLKRAIQRLLQNPLAVAVLEGQYQEGDRIKVDRAKDGNSLSFEKAREVRARVVFPHVAAAPYGIPRRGRSTAPVARVAGALWRRRGRRHRRRAARRVCRPHHHR
jgi:ATP-dependent Clp protease ATP-binding subunit ClpB